MLLKLYLKFIRISIQNKTGFYWLATQNRWTYIHLIVVEKLRLQQVCMYNMYVAQIQLFNMHSSTSFQLY